MYEPGRTGHYSSAPFRMQISGFSDKKCGRRRGREEAASYPRTTPWKRRSRLRRGRRFRVSSLGFERDRLAGIRSFPARSPGETVVYIAVAIRSRAGHTAQGPRRQTAAVLVSRDRKEQLCVSQDEFASRRWSPRWRSSRRCRPWRTPTKKITVSGSTSVFPLRGQARARVGQDQAGRSSRSGSSQGGSNVGVSDVSKGRVSIGGSSRDPSRPIPAAWCSPGSRATRSASSRTRSNPLGDISQAPVAGHLQGPRWITYVGQRPGSPIGGTVASYGRNADLGYVRRVQGDLPGRRTSPQAVSVAEKGVERSGRTGGSRRPAGDRLCLVRVHGGPARRPLNGVECNLRNAKSRQYGGTRSFYLVTRGAPVGGVKKCIRWILKSRAANKIIARSGYRSARIRVDPRFGLRKAGPRKPRRPARRADARRAGFCRAAADRGDDLLRLPGGMALLLSQRARLVRRRRQRRHAARRDLPLAARSPTSTSTTCTRWPLLYATILITGVAVVISTVFALLSAMFIVEFAPEGDPQGARAGRPAARRGAVGDLRADRDPRDRPVGQQHLHHRGAASLGRGGGPAQRRQRSASGS